MAFTVDHDQAIRSNASLEEMSKLRHVFRPDGAITAGNASPLNIGASSMLLMSKTTAEKKGIKSLATIHSIIILALSYLENRSVMQQIAG